AIYMKSTGIMHLAAVLALKRAGLPLKRDLVFLATADEEAGSRYGARFVADARRDWLAGAEYAISELGGIEVHAGFRAPLGHIVISEKTGLPLTLTARSDPGHGSMPWPDTAPHRLIRALGRLLAAERPLRVLPEVQEYFTRLASVLPGGAGVGYNDLAPSLADTAFRARFLTNRLHAAMVRTTLAVTMLHGSEKRNVIPPEASAGIDCRMLAGDDPEEIVAWVRRVIDDDRVEVTVTGEPKAPNLSPPDTELYKALADAIRRRVPGAVVVPEILVGFTDNWVFRRCGLHGYGWSPFILDFGGEWLRGDAARRRGGLSDSGRALDPPRHAARRAHDPPADPRPRRVRAARPPGGGDRRADPPPRLRPAALLRGARLPAGPHAHRPGTLLLHVLHVPRPADALPRGPLRPAQGARQRRRSGAPPGAREDRHAARLRPDGVDGARLEHALDPLLPEARRDAPARVDPHPSRRRAAPPPRGRSRAIKSQGVRWAQGRDARNAETPERREDSALGWVRPVTGCCTLRSPRSACRPRLVSRGPRADSGLGSRGCPLGVRRSG